MNFRAYHFHLDGMNYRLIVASRMSLEVWIRPNQTYAKVPAEVFPLLLERLLVHGSVLVGAGFLQALQAANLGMRLDVSFPRWRRWLQRAPTFKIQVLDLSEPEPWVDVSPDEAVSDVPVTLGHSTLVVYRHEGPVALWGIWAALNHQGYLAQRWREKVEEGSITVVPYPGSEDETEEISSNSADEN